MTHFYKLLIIILFLPVFAFSQNGQISGVVTDALTNEPVPFASALVDGTTLNSVTDINGKFIIKNIPPGYVKIKVASAGYLSTLSLAILVTPSNDPFIEIKLDPETEQLSEILLTVNSFEKKEESLISVQRIGIKEIETNPGSNRDISRVIQSFPGVGSTPAFRNDVIIRGGGPSENRFFLDEVEIPVLNHFSTQGASGGPVGIINADFIRSVDFYSSSFQASKYNALSGVLDFKLKEGSMDKTNFQFTLGSSEVAFTADGPIGNKTNYIFSIRRSYLQFLFSALKLPFLPTYNDFQFRVKTKFNKKSQLTIIGLGSLDNLSLNTGIKNPDPSQEFILAQTPVNDQWSYTIGGVYKNFFENGFHTVVLSRNMLNNSFYKYPDNDETREKSLDYSSVEIENKFRYELNIKTGGFRYNFSVNTEYAKYKNTTRQQVFVQDSTQFLDYTTDLNVIKYGFSGQASKSFFSNHLKTSFGIRFDGLDYNVSTQNLFNQFSPRLSLSYALNPELDLNAGLGRYYQQPAYTTLGFSDNNGNLVNKSTSQFIGMDQYNIGIAKRFGTKVLLSVEGFYKSYFDYPINLVSGSSLANSGADYSSVAGAVPAEFTGKGRAVGFEVLNRWDYPTFNVLASFTFVRSLFTDINDNWVPSSWDSQYILTLTGSKQFKNNWRVGLKYRLVGGLPYTPYDLDKSSYVEAWDAIGGPYLDFTQLNANRFTTFNQLDIRVDKNFFFNKWSLMLYFDVQNVLNTQYPGQDIIVRETNPDGTYRTVNNGSQYVLNPISNVSGTVLPTLGVIIKI